MAKEDNPRPRGRPPKASNIANNNKEKERRRSQSLPSGSRSEVLGAGSLTKDETSGTRGRRKGVSQSRSTSTRRPSITIKIPSMASLLRKKRAKFQLPKPDGPEPPSPRTVRAPQDGPLSSKLVTSSEVGLPTPSSAMMNATGGSVSAAAGTQKRKRDASVTNNRRDKGKGTDTNPEPNDIMERPQTPRNPLRRNPSGRSTKRHKVTPKEMETEVNQEPPALDTADEIDVQIDLNPEDGRFTPDFELLSLQDASMLPSLFMGEYIDVSSDMGNAHDTSMFVPSGVRMIIENMRQSLNMERSARKRTEQRYEAEVGRRVEAERQIKDLEQRVRSLEKEHESWTSTAATTLATKLEPAARNLISVLALEAVQSVHSGALQSQLSSGGMRTFGH